MTSCGDTSNSEHNANPATLGKLPKSDVFRPEVRSNGDIHVVHLTSSRFFGGPERQILELGRELAPDFKTTIVSFSEDKLCRALLEEATQAGFEGIELQYDTPRFVSASKELKRVLARLRPSFVCVHGYKAGILGFFAGQSIGIPVVGVSRGWTAECLKVRIYEWLERYVLRHMDMVVCVSEAQAEKVRKAGVDTRKIAVIRNAIRLDRFAGTPLPDYRRKLESMFETTPRVIIGAAGRLSPEKGFERLIDASQRLVSEYNFRDFGVVLFGEGALRKTLQAQIDTAQLTDRFVLGGFTNELDQYMPHFDLFVQSSYTEGLPNVLLEAAAARVPVVATSVGGSEEVVVHGHTGLLVPARDSRALSHGIHRIATDESLRVRMCANARLRVARHFNFPVQATAYRDLFTMLLQEA